jgi:N6-adenosine-specific RNA methylase IME4
MNELSVRPNGEVVLHWYDTACTALANARTVDEVKDIRDRAMAMATYARQAQNKTLYADAHEVRKRAERRVGEQMAEQFKTIGKNTGARGIGPIAGDLFPHNQPPTLAAAGVDKDLAKAARAAAAVPEHEFEQMLAESRERIVDEVDRLDRKILNAGRRARTKATAVTVPEGKFSCIVIDPPWPMEKIERDVRPNQVGFEYPTMSEDELADFDIGALAADDCHLFCWTTQRFLPMAMRLIEAWDFRYVCEFVWHKPGGFQPVGLPQFNCEFVLYARLGSPRFTSTKGLSTCFEAPRREHSRKPDEFYQMVRRATGEPRIDVFSREQREGFAQYGNEPAKFAVTP